METIISHKAKKTNPNLIIGTHHFVRFTGLERWEKSQTLIAFRTQKHPLDKNKQKENRQNQTQAKYIQRDASLK